MIFIQAGNQDQARVCANWLELHPKGWRYLRDGDELLGTDHPKIVRFGTYRQNKNWPRIDEMAHHHHAYISRLEDYR